MKFKIKTSKVESKKQFKWKSKKQQALYLNRQLKQFKQGIGSKQEAMIT